MLPSYVAAMASQAPAVSVALETSRCEAPTESANRPSCSERQRQPVADGSPIAATMIVPVRSRASRTQPLIDHGALAASSADCAASGRDNPTPPSRNVALYGPKFARTSAAPATHDASTANPSATRATSDALTALTCDSIQTRDFGVGLRAERHATDCHIE